MTIVVDDKAKFLDERRVSVENLGQDQDLCSTTQFEIDKSIQNKLLISVAPDGYLKCVN